jgi:hypothetical protein
MLVLSLSWQAIVLSTGSLKKKKEERRRFRFRFPFANLPDAWHEMQVSARARNHPTCAWARAMRGSHAIRRPSYPC